jgi:glycosyltransferase involved in cell wall biosynthesis
MLLGGVDDVRQVYAAADVVVHPALHPEGFARVIVEAQLAGVPVVATRTGAAIELIEEGITGLLVPPSDPLALHAAVNALLSDPVAARALSARARSAAARFRPEYHVRAMEALYQRVVTVG